MSALRNSTLGNQSTGQCSVKSSDKPAPAAAEEERTKAGSRPSGSTMKKSTPIKPLQAKTSLSTKKPLSSASTASGRANVTNPYANIKSKVQTGSAMPSMKGALG